jgi:flavin reductase (DIM6/NTAB) family NADH-FMN oxidoreductase RutF
MMLTPIAHSEVQNLLQPKFHHPDRGVGTVSEKDLPDKLSNHGVRTFAAPGIELPLVKGCAGWLACKLVLTPHNQKTYDFFYR